MVHVLKKTGYNIKVCFKYHMLFQQPIGKTPCVAVLISNDAI